MYKRKRAGNTITRKINSTKDTAAKADKNHYISNSYLEGFIPIDTEYFTASSVYIKESCRGKTLCRYTVLFFQLQTILEGFPYSVSDFIVAMCIGIKCDCVDQ